MGFIEGNMIKDFFYDGKVRNYLLYVYLYVIKGLV